jgi:hypothetical protein
MTAPSPLPALRRGAVETEVEGAWRLVVRRGEDCTQAIGGVCGGYGMLRMRASTTEMTLDGRVNISEEQKSSFY